MIKVVGFGVSSDYGVPEVDASVGRFVEQVLGRKEITIDGVESYDSSWVKWVF